MPILPEKIDPDHWMHSVFSSRDARCGGVIKRQTRDIERIVGRDAFLQEVERRGRQALENGRHFIICCNAQPIRRIRSGGSPAPAFVLFRWNLRDAGLISLPGISFAQRSQYEDADAKIGRTR